MRNSALYLSLMSRLLGPMAKKGEKELKERS